MTKSNFIRIPEGAESNMARGGMATSCMHAGKSRKLRDHISAANTGREGLN